MKTFTYKDTVEFREEVSNGTRVIRVSLSTPTPRVVCFCEMHRASQCSQVPMAMYVDELVELVTHAQKLLKENNHELK